MELGTQKKGFYLKRVSSTAIKHKSTLLHIEKNYDRSKKKSQYREAELSVLTERLHRTAHHFVTNSSSSNFLFMYIISKLQCVFRQLLCMVHLPSILNRTVSYFDIYISVPVDCRQECAMHCRFGYTYSATVGCQSCGCLCK